MSGSVGDGGESGEKPIPAAIELAKPGEPGEPGEPELEGVWLPAKSTKPGRFFLDTVFFAISEGSSHPRTTMPILKTAKAEERAEAEVRPEVRPEVRKVKKYLIFLSFFYVTNSERPDPGFFSRLGREPKLLGSSHPAVTLSRSPEDLKNYQDVNRVVFFGQLMAAFLSGTRVRVPDVRKVTDAMYRSEWIANLSVNVDLNTYFTEEIKG